MNSTRPPTLLVPAFQGGIFFVTLRLRDALPERFMQSLGLQYYTQQVKLARHPDCVTLLQQTRKRLFTRFDDALDLCQGPLYFREPALADIIFDEIHERHEIDYNLLAYTILPNHVHLLLQFNSAIVEPLPLEEFDCIQFPPLRKFVARLQVTTEKSIKHELLRRNEYVDPFTFQKRDSKGVVDPEEKLWHERTFDFYVQNQTELEKIEWYILQNAQKAELIKYWQDWPYTHW